MSNHKNNKLIHSSDSQSQSEEVIQLSIKKPNQQIKIIPQINKSKTINKKLTTSTNNKPKINPQLKKLLQQKIQDQKILKQLQKGPLNFGTQEKSNNKKILLIQEKIKTQKKQIKTGVNLVFQKKALPRQGSNRLSTILSRCNNLRGNMDVIRTMKSSKV